METPRPVGHFVARSATKGVSDSMMVAYDAPSWRMFSYAPSTTCPVSGCREIDVQDVAHPSASTARDCMWPRRVNGFSPSGPGTYSEATTVSKRSLLTPSAKYRV